MKGTKRNINIFWKTKQSIYMKKDENLKSEKKSGTKYVTQLERVRWLYLEQVC